MSSRAPGWIAILLMALPSTAHAEPGNWVSDALRAWPILNLQSPAAGPQEIQDPALSKPHPAVARIIVPESDGTTYGSGTLVDVRGDYGLVVTNWHVVEAAKRELWVEFSDGFRSAGKLLKVDRDWDLAAIAIWKPNAPAVTLSQIAPQPGDPLVIAGYGNGPFLAARGECLQYVTPSLELPMEMVQVSAAARNGDSGGPIFNDRGELAGVLFGTGEGVTSGSYCGRVNQFLASVLPKSPPQPVEQPQAAPTQNSPSSADGWSAPSIAAAAAPSTITVNEAAFAPPATVQDFGLSVATPPPDIAQLEMADAPVALEVEGSNPADVEPSVKASADSHESMSQELEPAPTGSPRVSQESPHSEVDWLSLFGHSASERLKTALAIVGLCTLIWHTVRMVGGTRSPAAT